MSEYEEVEDQPVQTDEEGNEETVELRNLVILDVTTSIPINGVQEGYKMGDVVAVRSRQGRRYIQQVDNGIMDVRWAEDENGQPEDAYEVVKSELKQELGKVGEVPELKRQYEAIQG